MKISNVRNINRILREDSIDQVRSRSVGSVVSASVSTLMNTIFQYLTDALPGVNILCGPLVALSPLIADAIDIRLEHIKEQHPLSSLNLPQYTAYSTDSSLLEAGVDFMNNVRDNDGMTLSVKLPDDVAQVIVAGYDSSKVYSAGVALKYDEVTVDDVLYYGIWYINDNGDLFPFLVTDEEPAMEDDVITSLSNVYLCANVQSVYIEPVRAAKNRESFDINDYGVTDLGNLVRSQLENGTVMTLFHRVIDKCRVSVNNGIHDINLTDVLAQATAVAGSGDTAASQWISEMNEELSSNFTVSNIMSWMSTKLRDVTSATTTSGLISFANNASLVTKQLVSGMFTGIVTVLSSLVSAISMAVGGVVGVIGVVGSFIAQGACKLWELTNTTVDQNSIAQLSQGSFDGFPLGFFQGAALFNAASTYTDLYDVIPAFSCEDPSFLYFQCDDKSPYAQVMLKYNVQSLQSLADSGLVTIGSNTLTLSGGDYYSYLLDDLDKNPLEFVDLTSEELDVLLRARMLYGYCWLLAILFRRDTSHGANSLSYDISSLNTDNVDSYVGTTIASIMSIFSLTGAATADNVHNNLATFKANIPDWDIMTGHGGAGINAFIGASIAWSLNLSGTSYFQRAGGSLWPSGTDILTVIRSSLSSLPVRAHLADGHIGATAMLTAPIASVKLPVFTKAQFWAAVTWTIILTAITTAAVVTTAILARNASRRLSSMNSAKVENAWSEYTQNPSAENFKAYKKAVKHNNFLAKLTGGTTYSYKGYWLSTDDEGESQSPSSNEKFSTTDVLLLIDPKYSDR